MTPKKYVIRSVQRHESDGYFAAIHGFSPYYSSKDRARRFSSRNEAEAYALKELFNDPSGFDVEEVI